MQVPGRWRDHPLRHLRRRRAGRHRNPARRLKSDDARAAPGQVIHSNARRGDNGLVHLGGLPFRIAPAQGAWARRHITGIARLRNMAVAFTRLAPRVFNLRAQRQNSAAITEPPITQNCVEGSYAPGSLGVRDKSCSTRAEEVSRAAPRSGGDALPVLALATHDLDAGAPLALFLRGLRLFQGGNIFVYLFVFK